MRVRPCILPLCTLEPDSLTFDPTRQLRAGVFLRSPMFCPSRTYQQSASGRLKETGSRGAVVASLAWRWLCVRLVRLRWSKLGPLCCVSSQGSRTPGFLFSRGQTCSDRFQLGGMCSQSWWSKQSPVTDTWVCVFLYVSNHTHTHTHTHTHALEPSCVYGEYV